MPAPKLFVSYSWTSPDHEAWVLQLATELRESGIDVILDKWDLREGHDAHAFMEKMVTDREIRKVILVCDKAYVEKADGRRGGVGTEAQIITGEIYEKQAQDKFVAVVTERNEEGRAYLPAYYRSRIYIDLSDASKYSENFERLLRWAYDKPLYQKPEVGETPAFISEENAIILGTSSRYKRALDAVRNHRDYAQPATAEYFTCLAEELEKFRLGRTSGEFDDAVVQSIDAFTPYRNQTIELVLTLAAYSDSLEMVTTIHRFFEQLIPYLDRPPNITTYQESDFDNFRFIIHELFLYAVAGLVRRERFQSTAYLMSNDYYVPCNSSYGQDVMVQFDIFSQPMTSLENRNKRLQLGRSSVIADLLEQRCKGGGIHFRDVMQADLILFLRGCLQFTDFHFWFPHTLVYAGRQSAPFEVFARSRSASYFERAKVLIGIDSKEQLQTFLATLKNRHLLPRWGFHVVSPTYLLGLNEIATKP